MNEAAITFLIGVVILVGLAGTVVPWFPDVILIWGAGLAYGLLVGWGSYGGWMFGLMTVAGVASFAADAALSTAGARLGGASGRAIAAGLLLGLIGFFAFPPLGAVLGFGLGVLIVESLRRRDARHGLRATAGAVLGWGAAFVAKFLLALLMAAAWGAWVAAG